MPALSFLLAFLYKKEFKDIVEQILNVNLMNVHENNYLISFNSCTTIFRTIKINFDKNESDMNFILFQRRFDASCIIFKLQVRNIRTTFIFS